ncbi:MAG: type II secretion system protein GspG [Xenococcaceae cyanobacterium]
MKQEMNKRLLMPLLILCLFYIASIISLNKRSNLPKTSVRSNSEKFKIVYSYTVITKNIPKALKFYESHNGMYPTTLQGLAALVNQPTTEPIPTQWTGPYIKKELLLDPWKNSYTYTKSEGFIEITSLGPDGQKDTEDDIKNIFALENQQPIAIKNEKIPQLIQKIKSAIEPSINVDSLMIKQNGEFLLKGNAEGTIYDSRRIFTLVTVLKNNPSFKNVKVEKKAPRTQNHIEFVISGIFRVNTNNEQQITDDLEKLQFFLTSSCMKFDGFITPSESKCDFKPENLVYISNPDETITFKWDCPTENRASDFYWFCCSCEDNTSHKFPVQEQAFTLKVDPSHEYAYSISCRNEEGILECPSKLEAIKYQSRDSSINIQFGVGNNNIVSPCH